MGYVRGRRLLTCLTCIRAVREAAGPAEPNICPASETCLEPGCLATSLNWGLTPIRLAALGYSTVSVCPAVTCMAVGLLKERVHADLLW